VIYVISQRKLALIPSRAKGKSRRIFVRPAILRKSIGLGSVILENVDNEGRSEIMTRKKTLSSRQIAQREAKKLRRVYGNTHTVNVKRITKTSWGVRFSPKGKRDKFDYRKR